MFVFAKPMCKWKFFRGISMTGYNYIISNKRNTNCTLPATQIIK